MEPAAAGAASPRYETGGFKISAHLVYSRLPVAVKIRSERREEGFLLSSGGGIACWRGEGVILCLFLFCGNCSHLLGTDARLICE